MLTESQEFHLAFLRLLSRLLEQNCRGKLTNDPDAKTVTLVKDDGKKITWTHQELLDNREKIEIVKRDWTWHLRAGESREGECPRNTTLN